MKQNYKNVAEDLQKSVGQLAKQLPDTMKAFSSLGAAAKKTGALDPKTKELIATTKQLGFSKGLIVVESISHELMLASRNLANIYLLNVSQISPVSLLKVDKILITVGALKKIEESLS